MGGQYITCNEENRLSLNNRIVSALAGNLSEHETLLLGLPLNWQANRKDLVDKTFLITYF